MAFHPPHCDYHPDNLGFIAQSVLLPLIIIVALPHLSLSSFFSVANDNFSFIAGSSFFAIANNNHCPRQRLPDSKMPLLELVVSCHLKLQLTLLVQLYLRSKARRSPFEKNLEDDYTSKFLGTPGFKLEFSHGIILRPKIGCM